MDEVTGSLARVIGSRVRSERQGRRLTLDELAEVSGVSRRSVVNVEQGEANPSVGILLKLGDALGIGLPALVAPAEGTELAVTRAGSAPRLWSGDHGGAAFLVAGLAAPDVVELWDWRMIPGERHGSDAHVAGTQELIHIHAGVVTLEVDGQHLTLQAGDSMAFPGDVEHAYSNEHATPARFSLCVYEPAGTGRRRAGTSHATSRSNGDAR